jgi:5-methylcytosine-specific restriction endonuclease McrA
MEPLVLTVDMAGLPQAWVELEEAITYHAKHLVAWSVGEFVREYRGGYQRNGERSRIATKLILAIKGSGAARYGHAPGLTNALLFARDRQLCAYCGSRFMLRDLSRDHVEPVSRGGRDVWTNTVSACRSCNTT